MTFIPNYKFCLAVSRGLVPGHGWVNKFGANDLIADGATETIWDGSTTYTWPTSASITHVRSAVDSVITRSVSMEVQGLDTNWDLVVQDVTTDAADSTTEVALGTALRRIFRVKIEDDTAMDQAIWVGPTGFATQQAIVQAGNNQTLMAIYTVPNGKTAYMSSYYGDAVKVTNKTPNSVDFRLWVADIPNSITFQLKHSRATAAGGFQHYFDPPLKITEKQDIKMTATPEGDDTSVHSGFNLTLVDN